MSLLDNSDFFNRWSKVIHTGSANAIILNPHATMYNRHVPKSSRLEKLHSNITQTTTASTRMMTQYKRDLVKSIEGRS